MATPTQPHMGKIIGRAIAIIVFAFLAIILAVIIMQTSPAKNLSTADDARTSALLQESQVDLDIEEQESVIDFIQSEGGEEGILTPEQEEALLNNL